MKIKKKGLMVGEYLGWWILALAGLVVILIVYLFVSGKGAAAIDYLQRVLRFGR